MKLLDKHNCILCKYNKYNKNGDKCFNHQEKDEHGYPIGECNSLSNIYYGKIVKHFPFKQIDDFLSDRAYQKEEKYNEEMNKKYGNYLLETDELKFIWGIKSWDDLSGSDTCLDTMNDIEIIYDKKGNKYMLDVETAYMFDDFQSQCNYLKRCLKAFTKYMDDNGLNKNKPYILFMSNLDISLKADTIEELYTNFKIFVDGFCGQESDVNE